MLARKRHAGHDWCEYVDVIGKNSGTILQHDRMQIRRIVRMLKNFSGPIEIADIGCGDGIVTEMMIRLIMRSSVHKRCHLTIIEPNPYLGALALKRISRLSLPVDLVALTVEKYFPSQDRFNVIICTRSAHHFKNFPVTMKSIYNCLKQGGILFVDDLIRPTSHAELRYWLRRRAAALHHAASQKMAEACLLASYSEPEISRIFDQYRGTLSFREDWFKRWSITLTK